MKMNEELEKIRCEVEKLRVEKKNHVDHIQFFENNRKRMADELDNMDGRMKQKNADLETAYMRQKQKDSDMESFELRIKKLMKDKMRKINNMFKIQRKLNHIFYLLGLQ